MKKDNVFFILVFLIFLFVTLPGVLAHLPNYDESNAWMVARNLDFSSYLGVMGVEGHGVIWFLLLMPFAKNNLFYPHSLILCNYLLFLISLILFWRKSPFDNVIKLIFTFSFASLSYFSFFARCYSLTILALFLLTYYYENSTKRPILYSLLIAFAVNTSAMGLVGASAFTILFIINIYKNRKFFLKKNIILSSLILIFSYCFFLFPMLYRGLSEGLSEMTSYRMKTFECFVFRFTEFFLPESNCLFIFSFIFLVFYLIRKNKNYASIFFLVYTFLILILFLTFIYQGEIYHRFFFFVFIIITLWLKHNILKKNDILLYLTLACLFFTPYTLPSQGILDVYHLAKDIQENNYMYKNSIFYSTDHTFYQELRPYIVFDSSINVESIDSENIFDYSINVESIDSENIFDIEKTISELDKKVFVVVKESVEQWDKKGYNKIIYSDFIVYNLK